MLQHILGALFGGKPPLDLAAADHSAPIPPDQEATSERDTRLMAMMLGNPFNRTPDARLAPPPEASAKDQERLGAPAGGIPLQGELAPALPSPGRVDPQYLNNPQPHAELRQAPNKSFSSAAIATEPQDGLLNHYFRLHAQASMGDPIAALQLQALTADDKSAR